MVMPMTMSKRSSRRNSGQQAPKARQHKRKAKLVTSDSAESKATSKTNQVTSSDSTKARVITNNGNRSVIQPLDDHANLLTASARRGKRPVCGDIVKYRVSSEDQGDILAIEPRQTELARADFRGKRRVLAANLTQMIIVVAAKPATSLELVDRYLVAAELHGLQAAIAINKADLPETNQAFLDTFSPYAELGYPSILTSHQTEHGLHELANLLHDETSILLGQSGVGKSTLTQTMVSHDIDIRVGALSERAQLGQHTTTNTTWYSLADEQPGAIIDSPGVRDFTLEFIPVAELAGCFVEFRPYLGQCHFNNCLHRQEPNCAIRAAVDNNLINQRRHASYLQMLTNLTELRH